MVKDPYTLPHAELVSEFMHIAKDVGAEYTETCVSSAAAEKLETMHHLAGVIVARLDDKRPPIESGAVVVMKEGLTVHPMGRPNPLLAPDQNYTVHRVWYLNESWFLSFTELLEGRSERSVLYNLKQFNAIAPVAAA